MKTCTGCEAEIAAEAKTCPHCGAEMAAEAKDWPYTGLWSNGEWTMVEYAVILAVIAILVIVALKFLQPAISNTLNNCACGSL